MSNYTLSGYAAIMDSVQCQLRETHRERFISAYGRKPWAVSLSYCDIGKVLADIRHNRVAAVEVIHAIDALRRMGTDAFLTGPQIDTLYERVFAHIKENNSTGKDL